MATAPIRIGLIGAGQIAGAHVIGYQALPDLVRLTAVADPVRDAAERRAGDTGATVFEDYHDLLTSGLVDAVDICLPHHLHRDAIIAAADAGIDVLCEKPLCLTPEEAADISAAVQRSGITLMCAHNQLFMPPIAKARELIDAGFVGKVYQVRTTDSFYSQLTPETVGWRANLSTNGGGELIDTGYHPTYRLLHLAGGAPTEVVAMLSRHRMDFIEAEDSAQVLVRFDNDVVGNINTSWAYEPPIGTEKFAVMGELGWLWSDGLVLHAALRGEPHEVFEFEQAHLFTEEIRHFAQCLLNGTRPIHTEREGIEVLGVILAAYESARTGSVAKVLRA